MTFYPKVSHLLPNKEETLVSAMPGFPDYQLIASANELGLLCTVAQGDRMIVSWGVAPIGTRKEIQDYLTKCLKEEAALVTASDNCQMPPVPLVQCGANFWHARRIQLDCRFRTSDCLGVDSAKGLSEIAIE